MYDELVKSLRQLADYDLMDFLENRTYTQDIATEAADAIEELQGKHFLMKKTAEWLAEKVPRWIPVSERLPEENAPCIVYNKYYGPMVGWRVDGKRFRIPGSRFPDHPTHWMPLPSTEGLNET